VIPKPWESKYWWNQILVLLPNPIRTIQDVESNCSWRAWNLRIRFDAIKLTKEMLDDEVPIGFAGSPWTNATRWKDKDLKVLIKQRILF
jgi:uroporphyrinogen-III decarboxylase